MAGPSRVTMRAHAKINLDLAVLGRRGDGYHELRTLFQTIALHDTVTVTRARGPLTIDGDATDMPLDRTNLAWRAGDALWQAAGRPGEPVGARIAIVKRIPAKAGLGGGSSDAAAALIALNRVWRLRMPAVELFEVAAGLGADVPFFLVGGTALGLGRGDQVYPLTNLPSWPIVLAWPERGVSTADAYMWLAESWAESGLSPIAISDQQGPNMLGLAAGNFDGLKNDLEGPVEAHRPEIRQIRLALEAAGAKMARMSGSGAASFGVFGSTQAAARAARALGRGLGREGWRTVATRILARGRLLV